MKAKSWEVTDDFWKRAEALIPTRQRLDGKTYLRKAGGGRKPKDARLVFEGIVYVLKTGCQWKALPANVLGAPVHPRTFSGMGEGRLFRGIMESRSCRI